MYRILLVDDEVHICQLIRHLVDWEALDAELCGMAHDGVEAYEMVQSLKPHVVISDIRMSGMDGIGLLEKIRSAGMQCAFVLVSGYRQFEYAQKAIQLGVTDYLVKPIKKKELNEAIRKGLSELQIKELQPEVLRTEVATPVRRAVQDHLESLVGIVEADVAKLGECSLSQLAEQYGVSLQGQQMVIYGKCTCDEAYPQEVLGLLFGHLKGRFRENDWFEKSFCASWNGGYLLVGASEKKLPSLAAVQRQCQMAISAFAHWRVVLGSCVPEEGQNFRAAAMRARHAANHHFFLPAETTFSGMETAIVQFEDIVDNRTALADAMQVLDAAGVRELVKEGYRALEPHRSPEAVFAYTGWLIDAMNHALSAFTTSRSGLEGLRYLHRNELQERLYYCSSLRELRTQICDILETKIQKTREAIEQQENKPVRIIRDMVAERYMEHISLNDAAELVDLNPVYLSVLFKRETGINFKDYVINVRMDKAKELLRRGESINRVADLVGYQDTKYFSRLFARVVGVNPTQYKKLYQ